jgi:DNA-binding LacI/PurR family transcriptional regulator
MRRFAYVVRPLTAATVDARIAGALTALRLHGLEPERSFVQSGDPLDLKFVKSFVRSNQIDGVFCASDHIAAQLLQSLNRLGIRVPKDLRLVGLTTCPSPACSLCRSPRWNNPAVTSPSRLSTRCANA